MGRTVRLDPIPGGDYFVHMADGFAAVGTFIELVPSQRIEFTWGWAQGAGESVLASSQPDDLLPPGSSRVKVRMTENEDAAMPERHLWLTRACEQTISWLGRPTSLDSHS